jgi:cell division inhibitor SepF
MSSPLRKVALYLGLVDDGSDEALASADQRITPVNPAPVRAAVSPVAKSGGSRFFGSRASSAASSESGVTPTEKAPRFRSVETVAPVYREEPVVDRIITLHPHSYNDARMIGEHYRDHTPVIMNLTDMDDADAKRLVDFAAGLVFGHRGSIERVTAKVFLLSPPNVKVSAEDKFAAAEASFFNQS